VTKALLALKAKAHRWRELFDAIYRGQREGMKWARRFCMTSGWDKQVGFGQKSFEFLV